ncbi:dienelactone hydrolase family protein [Algoriphagus sp. CAU 1675]|uniref:alpha/beta hydrolase n=1 Tax=Algoriphagus sp. CAU 1675 TaxID=3032597 RepID=UPI0023DBA1DE|nr:dienelactone hydrolase family protein [Algoriphagus sp. CAU 1675]MDF2158662.1 dienelactone hydrolase family protein [Algoriphagus sp. CAU 1675]
MPELRKEGKSLQQANKAAILIHGRGASSSSILGLKEYLNLDEFALIAPQAEANTWYPYSFMAPDKSNEVALKSSLEQINNAFSEIVKTGIAPQNIFLIGFSQGACLSLEFAALHAQKLGGVIAFTGGLIGQDLQPEKYSGDFEGTQIFIGSSKRDFHVPMNRIMESAKLLQSMGANVKTLLFEDSSHTIRKEEIDWVNQHILS